MSRFQDRESGGRHAPRLMRVWIAALLTVIGVIGAGWLIYFFVVDRLVVDTSDAIKTTLAILTLAGAVLAGVYAYRRQRIAESDAHRADANQFADRYTTAAEQLGHERAAVRLAGVYALARLADDWKEQRQVCIDVLCAYLRMPYQPDQEAPGYKEGEREVRLTIIRLVRDHLRHDPESPHSWHGRDFDFTGATFDGGDFSGAVFSSGRVRFTHAVFSGGTVRFDGAKFSGSEVSFIRAKFSGGRVSFDGATFPAGTVRFAHAMFFHGKVSFDGAEFSGGTVSFTGTEFSGAGGLVCFNRAVFSGGTVRFTRATFSASGSLVRFDDAVFSGGTVGFDDATFSGSEVRFARATFAGGEVSFHGATFAGGSVDFQSVASWDSPPHFDDLVATAPPAGLLLPPPDIVRPS